MTSFPNQLKVVVKKSKIDKMRGYSITDKLDEEVASQILNAGAFKLWRYCARNADGYSFWLSPKAIEKEIKKDQFYKARNELAEKGYLTQTKAGSNIFIFRERLEMEDVNYE